MSDHDQAARAAFDVWYDRADLASYTHQGKAAQAFLAGWDQAVAAERERCARLAFDCIATYRDDSGARTPFADLLRQAPGA